MTLKTDSPVTFIADFEKVVDQVSKNTPEWFNAIRQRSLIRLNHLGIPTTKDEEWKYTNISPVTQGSFHLADSGRLKDGQDLRTYLKPDEINIVFINGIFSKEYSRIEGQAKGISIMTLQEAMTKHPANVEKLLTHYNPAQENFFVSLNNVLTQNGVFVQIDKNARLENVIHFVFVTNDEANRTVGNDRNLIWLGPSSEATVLESHICFSDTPVYLSNPLTDIHLSENATLHYCKAQKESLNAFHIGNTRIWLERNANLDGFSMMTGGAITRNNLDIVLNGEGCNAILNGLYSIYGKQLTDNHTYVDHRQPNCKSNQYYKGILNGSSHAVFNGKIFVHPIAQQTNSYQLNKNLLVGKDCRIDTKPQLEIFADDVKCTHGATIGQLNEEEIFYLQSRCISKRQAVKMLSRGFVDDLLNTITNQSINDKLHILLEPSLKQI
jgi:Fe-S cluster assembly protein SufD